MTIASVPFATPIVSGTSRKSAASRSNAVNVRAEDELSALEHVGESLLELGDERLVLSLDVDESDLHGTPVYPALSAVPRR